jgi:hypothetical protein
MIIVGHHEIESEKLYRISSFDEISKTPPNSTILTNFNIQILKFAKKNSVEVAVVVKNLESAILSEQFDVKYIISDLQTSSEIQKIADNYLYNSKILAEIELSSDLVEVAKNEIDGAIFTRILNES